MTFEMLPQDIIDHIGVFYITKQMKLKWRIDKMNKKVEELEHRTINEWICHLKFSKIYKCIKITEINEVIEYTNSWGDKYKCDKNNLLDQGYIAHIRQLYRWYINRIIDATTPVPQYVGETYTNIVGKKLTAKMVQYGDLYYKHLVFV
jgi:hypothetical protein